MKRATPLDGYNLLMEGSLALAEMERNGIKMDEAYLDSAIKTITQKIKDIEVKLQKDDVFKVWRKRFKEKTKLGSLQQLGEVLFTIMKYPCYKLTATGRPKTDEEALKLVDHSFVRDYLHLGDLRKDKSTYLEGIKREIVNGFLHPMYSLHTVTTFRSSCQFPNLQNVPSRNFERMQMIRRAFVARPGRHLVEVDFSGIEVRVSACIHKDPVLIKYIEDPTTDMHRDTACDLFFLDPKQVGKKTTRDWSKNRFVFPQFYGSVYFQCAPDLWAGVLSGAKLEGSNTTVKEHLASKGIKELGNCDPRGRLTPGTFVHRVKQVEDSFWSDRFKGYTQWKRKTWERYQETQCFDLVTGFHIEGIYKKNEVLNYPIQGPAFHCLLWSIIQLQKWLTKNRMRTKTAGQIHDSAILDVPTDELDDVLAKCRELMTVDLPRHWKWWIVPVEVEVEMTEEGGSWDTKKKVG